MFTYFDLKLQTEILYKIVERLSLKGFLIIGAHEELPADERRLKKLGTASSIFQMNED